MFIRVFASSIVVASFVLASTVYAQVSSSSRIRGGAVNSPTAPSPFNRGGKSTPATDINANSKVDFSKAQPEDITNENFPDLVESFDYPNADISEVVKAISKLTGKNFILDSNVRGKITIIAPSKIAVAEAYRAFLTALAMNNLTVVPSGNFLKIRQSRNAQTDSLETYAGNYYPNTDQMITRIVKLKYISAEEIHKSLRILNSKDGVAYPYGPTNSLIITDYGSHIERVMNILSHLDVPGFEEQLAVIRIQNAKAKDISALVDKIINKGQSSSNRVPRFRRNNQKDASSGSGAESYSFVAPDDRTNSVIVVGNTAGIAKIRKLVRQLDFPLRPEDSGGVYVYYVRHGEAEKITNALNGVASDSKKAQEQAQKEGSASSRTSRTNTTTAATEGGEAIFGGDVKVTPDKDTNSLIITASRQDYDVVKSILNKIDISRDQVFVKAVIMEMNAAKTQSWGIDYYTFDQATEGIGRVGFRGSTDISSLLSPAADSGAVLGFGSGDTFDITIGGATQTVASLTGLIKLLKSNAGGNVLSTPQIMAIDNEEAEIEVGQEIPVGTTSAVGTGATPTTTSIERKKATIKLTLTPYISPDTDTVRMKITQQVSSLSNEPVRAAQLAQTSVITNERSIKTTIVTESGDTAVLGGLMQDQENETTRKVPILGDIPIIGWLFKSRSVEKSKQNLMVFITPKIIRSNQDNSEIVDQKLDERISFIQRHMNGRDPHGETVDNLPRKVYGSREDLQDQEQIEVEPAEEGSQLEEPAVETF